MQLPEPNPYDVLGLPPGSPDDQIRSAYRLLAKQYHPDVNRGSAEAVRRTQELNAAYAILGDPVRRQAFDQVRTAVPPRVAKPTGGKSQHSLAQELHLGLTDFIQGASLEVRVIEPSNPHAAEVYPLRIPPGTAPGSRFRLARTGPFAGGIVSVKVKARSDARFQVRGSDLRCDLRITAQRATQGGVESVRGITGSYLRVPIPARVARGEIIRLADEGLPRLRGGRGDLLVRLCYNPEVRITRLRKG